MRTLKKTLALVLVVAMMMSLCITSNAAFTDADKIEYVEAVEVMTEIGVIDGFPAGDFQPQGSLTRAQAAKILVYLLGEEAYAKADGQIFDDVPTYHWAADYIAYCAENKLVDGYGDGKFGPEDKLTGYQWAKMLLAALGEDTTEMIGAAWQIPVAKAAAAYGLFDGNEAADKTEIATREEACLYALNAMLTGTVSYGYPLYVVDGNDKAILEYYNTVTEAAHAAAALNEYADDANTGLKFTIGYEKVPYNAKTLLKTIHGLTQGISYDYWGCQYTTYTARNGLVVLAYPIAPVATSVVRISECDIAAQIGLKSDADVLAYTYNGDTLDFENGTNEINLKSMAPTVGGQGALTLVYASPYVRGAYEVVVIDEYLAMVVDVDEIKYDKNGHVLSYAQLDLEVFSEADGSTTAITLEDYAWEYEVGDMLLVYYDNEADKDDRYAEIVGYAESMIGEQTAIYRANYDAVEIDEADVMKAVQYNHVEAVAYDEYLWYVDSYGNVIGSFEIADEYTWATISSIYWKDSNDGENGYAVADITYMDGTKAEDVVIYSIADDTNNNGKLEKEEIEVLKSAESINANYEEGEVCETKQYNVTAYEKDGSLKVDGFTNRALYQISEGRNGLELVEVAELTGSITTGVPKINNDLNAGKSTMFLVWNGRSYETYTGIKNVPTYVDLGSAWYVDVKGDGVADYIFLSLPTEKDAVKTVTYWNTDVVIKEHSYGAGVYYTIAGGFINAADEAETITTYDYNVAKYIKNNAGKLLVLELTDEVVTAAAEVTNLPVNVVIGGVSYKVVYAGAASAYDLEDGDLFNAGNAASYDVDEVEEIGYIGIEELYDAVEDVEDMPYDPAYLYIVYIQAPAGQKIASTVYITPVEGVGDDVAELSEIDAIIKALGTSVENADSLKTVEDALTAAGKVDTDKLTVAKNNELQAAIAVAENEVADYKFEVAEKAAIDNYAAAIDVVAGLVTDWADDAATDAKDAVKDAIESGSYTTDKLTAMAEAAAAVKDIAGAQALELWSVVKTAVGKANDDAEKAKAEKDAAEALKKEIANAKAAVEEISAVVTTGNGNWDTVAAAVKEAVINAYANIKDASVEVALADDKYDPIEVGGVGHVNVTVTYTVGSDTVEQTVALNVQVSVK